MPENYAEIEARIEAACERLSELDKPNIAVMAREFQVLYLTVGYALCGMVSNQKPSDQQPTNAFLMRKS